MILIQETDAFTSKKILSFDEAAARIKELKSGKSIGLCHGGFDMLHVGHMKHFESAKELCDVLFVSVTSNRYVSSRKGSGRPIFSGELRAYAIASLAYVDYVVISDFAKGVEVINGLKPSFYIKGPDFIHKTTPGITSEREAIAQAGGEMKYTTDVKLATTEIIDYIKNKLDVDELLVIIDRDGTIIKNNDFLGKNENWMDEIELNDPVVSYLSYLQTKYKMTKIVVTNQGGVARNYFDCARVEKINSHLASSLGKKGITIDRWEYCPDVNAAYAESKKKELEFDSAFVKEHTRRKPSTSMVDDALRGLKRNLTDFSRVIVIGDRHEDGELAQNLNAVFVDVNEKGYDELLQIFS